MNQPEWISVEDERTPKEHNELCLVFREDGIISLAVHYEGSDRNYWSYGDVTHWMSLPDPPKPKEPTFKDVFLEKFPKATIFDPAVTIDCCAIFPWLLDEEGCCQKMDITCDDCWNQPYFEPQEEGETDA